MDHLPGPAGAGPDAQPVPGALIHSLRHTYATELATADVSVYTLMKLLGHESMTTSQRYVTAAGAETRSAAAKNSIYGLIRAVEGATCVDHRNV
ncbi:tyrosine-type recombinase/integrase [Mycobacteroides salmoniphilum]|uniref:tyrosine-type recombinase/integrase n=1 Tax=Mycobacteroides salmoniphilum TaxID=404941 RepID=UPI001066CCDB|nr:site-specific tyrosine recombinase XerS [Mycobacteroides salmoniphilum]